MVLVDSSVWIAAGNAARVRQLVGDDDIVTCLPVIEEVLRGARTEENSRAALAEFRAMPILDSPMPFETFEYAAMIYRIGRAAAITIRSPYDCLIAACAIRNAVEVVHADRDFDHIARFTTLKQRNLAS